MNIYISSSLTNSFLSQESALTCLKNNDLSGLTTILADVSPVADGQTEVGKNDFPLPEVPTTERKRCCRNRQSNSVVCDSRPKNR